MKRKLLFVTSVICHGGSLKMFVWLANKLTDYYDVYYCIQNNEVPFYKLNDKVKCINLKAPKYTNYILRNTVELITASIELLKIVDIYKFDMIINFADHMLYSLCFVKKFLNVKLLISQRVDPFLYIKRSDKFRIYLYKYADGLVCQTKNIESFFKGKKFDSLKKAVIPNPALGKTTFKWNKDNNDGYIVSLARIDFRQKRQDVLIEAMKKVHRQFPNVKLFFYGEADKYSLDKLNSMIEEAGLDGVASYCGITDNVYKVLSRASICVLTSDFEGIPNIIIEAMQVGLPIISTDYMPGGIRMLIDTDDKGKIVERGNPSAVANAIIEYLNNKELAAKHAENAHNSLSRFDEDVILNNWIEFINSIICL